MPTPPGRRTRALLAAGWLAAALVVPPGCADEGAPVPEEVVWADQRAKQADQAFAEERFAEAATAYRAALERLDAAAPHPDIPRRRAYANYNLACAEVRLGNLGAACEALEAALPHGLRPIPGPSGAAAPLTLPFLLADGDLDALRDHPAYAAALRPYLEAGEPLLAPGPETARGLPAVLVLAPEGALAAPALEPWQDASAAGRVVAAALSGPVRPVPEQRLWAPIDGDLRWGRRKIEAALAWLRTRPQVDPRRVLLVARGPAAGEAAWAAALHGSADLAGLVVLEGRFHPHFAADALAARAGRLRVVVGERDVAAQEALRRAGVEFRAVRPDAPMEEILAPWME